MKKEKYFYKKEQQIKEEIRINGQKRVDKWIVEKVLKKQ